MATTKKEYYAVLGLNKSTATEKDIRLAYRRLAVQYHPDKNDSPEAVGRFQEISEAYAILSDPQKKQEYDRYGRVFDGSQLTPEQALEMYWNFFRPQGWERKEEPSFAHGAYVMGAGAVSAPLKGMGAGAALAGTGAVVGAAQMVGGTVSGIREVGRGLNMVVRGAKYEEEEKPDGTKEAPSAMQRMSRGITRPIGGVLGGAATAVLGLGAGATVMATGGIGGAAMNIKAGGREIADRFNAVKNPVEAKQADEQAELFLLEDEKEVAEYGRVLLQKAMSQDEGDDPHPY